jgi:LuxR family quorum-sensing system transcriptional regulator CciR
VTRAGGAAKAARWPRLRLQTLPKWAGKFGDAESKPQSINIDEEDVLKHLENCSVRLRCNPDYSASDIEMSSLENWRAGVRVVSGRRVDVMFEPKFRDISMPGLLLIETFIARARSVANEAQLRELMEDICRALGFRFYALIHHTDLAIARGGVININNYPGVWATHFIANKLYRLDPVLRATLYTNVGFAWSEIFSLIRRTTTDDVILDAARREGLADGFTVPIHVPGELAGSCSFATAKGDPMPDAATLRLAQLVGAFAFEAARRIARPASAGQPPKLTPRQRECLTLAAIGKTDWEISRILSLSPATTRVHMRTARARYAVCSRTQAVICALFNGEIGYSDVMR